MLSLSSSFIFKRPKQNRSWRSSSKALVILSHDQKGTSTYWGHPRASGQQCNRTASLLMQGRYGGSSLLGNAGCWALKTVLTLTPYFSQAELNWSIFVLFSFLTATFPRLDNPEHHAWSDNECLHATVSVSKQLHCFQHPAVKPHASQDKKATAEEGRLSCLTRAVPFQSETELTPIQTYAHKTMKQIAWLCPAEYYPTPAHCV